MSFRVLRSTKHFELREEHVRRQNSKKMRRYYRIRHLGWTTSAVIERMNQLIDPDINSGRTGTRRFRNRARAEKAFMILILGWTES